MNWERKIDKRWGERMITITPIICTSTDLSSTQTPFKWAKFSRIVNLLAGTCGKSAFSSCPKRLLEKAYSLATGFFISLHYIFVNKIFHCNHTGINEISSNMTLIQPTGKKNLKCLMTK